MDENGVELHSSRLVSSLLQPGSLNLLLVIPNEDTKRLLLRTFEVAGVESLLTLQQDCREDLEYSDSLAPAYQVLTVQHGSVSRLVLNEGKGRRAHGSFCCQKNEATFRIFLQLHSLYGHLLGQADHGLRAHMAFVLSSTQPLRVHNPVYRALRHVWTSDSEGEELCRKLMEAWQRLLSPQHPRSTSLNAAITADMAAASAYSTATNSDTCTIS